MGRDQVPLDEFQEVVQLARPGSLDGQAPHGKQFVDGFGGSDEKDGEGRQGGDQETFHRCVYVSITKIVIFLQFGQTDRKGTEIARSSPV